MMTQHKDLIRNLLYPKQDVWTNLAVGFIADTDAPTTKWYVNGNQALGNKKVLDYKFLSAGKYQVRVEAYDNDGGEDSRQCTVTVGEQPPCSVGYKLGQPKSAVLLSSADSKSGMVGFSLSLGAYGDSFQSIFWDWGSKDFPPINASSPALIFKFQAENPSNNYNKPGEYYGTVQFSTANGASCKLNFFILVKQSH